MNDIDEKYQLALIVVDRIARGWYHVYEVSTGRRIFHFGEAIQALADNRAVVGRRALAEAQRQGQEAAR